MPLSAQSPLYQSYDLEDPPEGLFAEDWMDIRLGGDKIGYAQVTLRREGDRIHTRSFNTFKLARGAASVALSVEESTEETLDGEPVTFRHTVMMAGQPVVSEGVIKEGKLEYQLSQGSYTKRDGVPYPRGALMTWGLKRRMAEEGLMPGTRYEVEVFSPDLSYERGIPAQVEVVGRDRVEHHGQLTQVIRIHTLLKPPGNEIATELFVDNDGRAILSRMEMMGLPIAFILTTQEAAVKDFVPVEMMVSQLVELDQPIPADVSEVQYLLRHVSGSWPEGSVLPRNAAQTALLDASGDVMKVRVRRVDPAHPPVNGVITLSESERTAYLGANLMIDSDDNRVRELTREALEADAVSDWDRARLLRRFVAAYIEEKNLDIGFASAAEVARNPQGDCTEHAVLLAAMARAAGIPSRIAMGLWYLPRFEGRENIMGYHMWTQLFIDGRWIDIDAASTMDVLRPTRIALKVTSLRDDSLSALGLDLMDQLGQIKVSLADMRRRGD